MYFKISLIITLILFSLSGHAEKKSYFYVGVSGGDTRFTNNFKSKVAEVSVANDTGYSIYGGMNIYSGLSIELEYSSLDSKTDNIYSCSYSGSCGSVHDDVTVDSYATYIAYRSKKDIYFKTRIGYVYEEVNIDYPHVSDSSKYVSGFTYSIGSGVKLGKVNFEVEQTFLKLDINYTSIRMHYNF